VSTALAVRSGGDELRRVLRAALADDATAREAARDFVAGFDHHAPVDPRVFAALPAVQRWIAEVADPDDPRAHLVRGVCRQAWSRNQVRLAALQATLVALGRVGVAPVVLPGAFTAMAALGDAGARVLERVDVLVEPAAVPRVTAALLAAGAETGDDAAPLLAGRLAHRASLHLELPHGWLGVRWRHPLLVATDLAAVRAAAVPAHLGPVTTRVPRPADAPVLVLAELTDGGPRGAEWTNLVLELGRTATGVGASAVIEAMAGRAHDRRRHAAWAGLLDLVAEVSDRTDLADAAARFAAVPSPSPPRSPVGRAARLVRQYRESAEQAGVAVDPRGAARYLRERWRVGDVRSLPAEIARRVVRARRPSD
jgi:hypothetical protein